MYIYLYINSKYAYHDFGYLLVVEFEGGPKIQHLCKAIDAVEELGAGFELNALGARDLLNLVVGEEVNPVCGWRGATALLLFRSLLLGGIFILLLFVPLPVFVPFRGRCGWFGGLGTDGVAEG